MEKTNKNYLNTQVKVIILLVALLVVFIPLWFFVLKPAQTPTQTDTPTPTPSYSLYDTGTYPDSKDEVKQIAADNLESIHMTKGDHTWGFVYDYTDEMFFLDGYGKKIAYDTMALSFMKSFASLGTAQRKIADNVTDFAKYGLTPDSEEFILVKIKTRDGKEVEIYLGDTLVDGSGNYACVAGDKTVYTINPMNYGYFSCTEFEVMNTRINNPFTESEYVPNAFEIYVGGADEEGKPKVTPLLKMAYYDAETALGMELIKTTVVTYPETALPHGASGRYSDMLYNHVRDSILGEVVVAAEKEGEDSINAEFLKENFGIDFTDPACKRLVYYREFEDIGKIENDIWFSPKTKDGYYYAYNLGLGTVVKIKATSIAFIDWSVEQYMEPAVYMQSISAVKELVIDSTNMQNKYADKGNLKLKHTFNSNAPEEEDSDSLKVTFDGGKKLPTVKDDGSGNERSGLDNYRYLFLAIQTINVYEKIDVPEGVDLDKADITITIYTRSYGTDKEEENSKVVLRFYYYGGTRAYFTYNGGGGYSVQQSALKEMLTACNNVVTGKAVKS